MRDVVDGMTVLIEGQPSTIAARGVKSLGAGQYRLSFTDGREVVLSGKKEIEVVSGTWNAA
ncbi:MAG: hypothetical protein ACTHMZ_16060 [Actinomycetes bacterium]